MNQYSELLYYIKSLADADVFINTVTQGEQDEIDLNKANIFPLLHVFVSGGSFNNGQTVTFNVQLSCLDIRDKNKEIKLEPLTYRNIVCCAISLSPRVVTASLRKTIIQIPESEVLPTTFAR